MSVLAAAVSTSHLGALHPGEQVLTLVLAVAPLVVLGVLVATRRRQDAAVGSDAGADREAAVTRQPPQARTRTRAQRER